MMAKKKETSASPFVPEEEQPYQIPENWCWVRLGVLVESSKKKTADFSDSDIKYVGLEHMEKDGGIIGYASAADVKSVKSVFHAGQILYGKLRPYLNKHDIAAFDGVCSTDILVFDTKGCADKQYVNYFLNQRDFIEYAVSNSKGINLPRVSEAVVLEAVCPLPPFPEQLRIVARIDSLFAKLDEAKERAKAVVDGSELRKSTILHKAFSGKLTEQWRREHGMDMGNWVYAPLMDVCIINPRKADTKDLPDDLEVSFFPMPSLSEVYGEITEPQTRPLGEVRTGFTNFSEGDVVFAKITPCMENGKSAVIGELVNHIGYGTTEFFVLRCGKHLYNRYLYHLIRSQHFRDEAKAVMAGAVGQQRVPKSFLAEYPLHLPPVAEQKEIVRILDAVFARELESTGISETVLDQIGTMKKSILARAFRGELGTNDPAEESAAELLRTIQ